MDITENDLEILKMLWRKEALSAKEIHDQIKKKTGWSYSTSRTVVDRMVKKGLVKKAEMHGINVYSAGVSRVSTLGGLIRRFAENVLETDPRPVAALFSENAGLSKQEFAELSRLFDERVKSKKTRSEG